ncbi:MAG: hypothetical protein CMG54_05130 [Candidatus Marinimicrobia bacterium]|nr:hypothetical protein [Candidatus Neomarinimicrobiota bacterium]|tara:strand:- start:742 stop:1161 length:420 start_codon:yes stop_codon:yes gene_type:complete
MNFLKYFTVLFISFSFVLSNYTGVNKKEPFSFQKEKQGSVIKSENNNLKKELIQLENEFKGDYDEIKTHYKSKITSIKDMQKSEIQALKKNYNNRRKAIYKKYGVKPPKNQDNNSMNNSDVYSPKNKDTVKSPYKKLKK